MILISIGTKVIVAESIGQDELFPDKVWITGIEGAIERSYPDFQVTDLSIDKSAIGNVCHGHMRVKEPEQASEPDLKVVESGGDSC